MWEFHAAAIKRQNSRVWAKDSRSVQMISKDNFPQKIYCWCAVSAFEVIPLTWISGEEHLATCSLPKNFTRTNVV